MTGRELANARMELGRSQEDFAKYLKISRTYLARNEAAKDVVIPDQLEFKVKKAIENLTIRIPSLKGLGDLKQSKVAEDTIEYNTRQSKAEQSLKDKFGGMAYDVFEAIFDEMEMLRDKIEKLEEKVNNLHH